MEMEKALRAPYERFPCNQLRRECYRRKLPVVKTGPQANATKAGFLRLLREDDATKGNPDDHGTTEAPSPAHRPEEQGNALTIEPQGVSSTAPRVVSPPTSPVAFVEFPPQRPPRVEMTRDLKRDASVNDLKGDTEHQEKKRHKVTEAREPQPLSGSCFFSTHPSTSVEDDDEDPEPGAAKVASPTESNRHGLAEERNIPRWERLYARLEVVNTKLQSLYASRAEWLPRVTGPTNAEDIEFYEMMKRELKRGLLESVSNA